MVFNDPGCPKNSANHAMLTVGKFYHYRYFHYDNHYQHKKNITLKSCFDKGELFSLSLSIGELILCIKFSF